MSDASMCTSQSAFLIGSVVATIVFLFGIPVVSDIVLLPVRLEALSIPLAAVSITVVSIVATLPLTQANQSIKDQRARLTGYQRELKERQNRFRREGKDMYGRPLQGDVLPQMYERATKEIERRLQEIRVLTYRVKEGILSFSLLTSAGVVSAFYVHVENDHALLFTLVSLASFALGLGAFSYYLFNVHSDFQYITQILLKPELLLRPERVRPIPSEGGKLRVFRVRDAESEIVYEPDRDRGKEVELNVGDQPALRLRVEFEGGVRNGFLDARIDLLDADGNYYYIWVPDRNTFLSSVLYEYGLRLTCYPPNLYTGMLQGKCTYKDKQVILEYALRTPSVKMDTLIGSDGKERLFPSYKIPEGSRITGIQLCVYEDPFYIPDEERRTVACVYMRLTK